MEIVISGTKGGWGYFTDKQPLGLFDIGTGAGIKALTQQAYAITIKNNNCIFTKYRIIKDVRGDKRIGFVAFSLFLPFSKKMPGKIIKAVLDKVENEYCQKYISDGKNLEDVRENFNFLDTILDEYNKDIRSNSSVISNDTQSGSTDAAFVYYPYVYKDVQMQKEIQFEIEDIFDAPFQEEYTPYRQILFISKDLKGKDENPLVALQHSENDLTGKIDLKNEYYYLNNYNRSKGVTITANGKSRSDGKNDNSIRAKWQIEIRYSKDDRCYEPIQASGTLSNPKSEIFKYLEINGNQIKIKYDAFNNPTPKTKPIRFEIKDRNGKKIDGAEITYQTDCKKETRTSSIINFTGEEIVKRWTISAKKSDYLYSQEKSITPENQNGDVTLVLEEHKKVKISAYDKDNGDIIYGFKVYIAGNYNCNITDEIEFIGEEIERCFEIQIKKQNKYLDSEKKRFCPARDGNEIIFNLKKDTREGVGKQENYKVSEGKHGKLKDNYEYFSQSSSGLDVKDKIVPNRGYDFTHFELQNDTLVAQYEKKAPFYKKTKFIAGSVIGLFALCFSIWALCYFLNENKADKTLIDKTAITEYLEGDSLVLNKLNSNKENWERKRPEIKKEGGGLFGGGEERPDSTEYKEWDEVSQMIDIAIKKRELIDSKKFTELKNQNYSSAQEKFKDAINKIDSITSVEVEQKIGDISAFTLTQIADKINEITVQKESVKEEHQQELKKEEKETEMKKENQQPAKPAEQPKSKEQNTAVSTVQQQTISTDIIIPYIRGSELDEAKLTEYKNTKGISQNLKNSIQLCLDFWALDGSGSGKSSKTYWTFREKVNADNNLINSKLKLFLDKKCQEGANMSYSKQDKKKGLK